ncbi:ABC transporter ATP-binding protein [Candidatus Saccharibacteria bacterium]|nr:ABC transporter ATP-binding protein [Candidatus Saccharibacteria bacterium]MBP7834648.1 ABC transporter ATP-binding protein [Candidatus Saccharibacteria bacterium]
MSQQRNPAAIRLAVKHYYAELKRLKRYSLPALLLPGVGMILITYVPTLIVAAVITRFSKETPTLALILPYLLLFAGVWMLGEMIWRVAIQLLNINDAKGTKQLYINGLDELLRKDIGFFHNNFAGSLTKKTIGYAKNYELFSDTIAFNVFANILPILFAVIILWSFTPWLVFILLAMMTIVIAIIIPLIRRRQVLVIDRENASNVMAGHIADVIGNMEAVQAFAHEDFEAEHHKQYVSDLTVKAKKSWDYHNLKIDLVISPLYVLINVIGLAVAILVGGSAVNIAAVFVTFSYYAYITRILWEFNRIYRNLEGSITEAAQFTELLLDEPETKINKSKNPLTANLGRIEFNNVSFKYKDGNENLFENFNLSIKPGERVALVGHSGSGKTTVTKLLLRFKEINNGELLIDGQDISKCTLNSLRNSISYVPQESVMFHRTIADNIRYGMLGATDDQVIAAAKKANAHEFIEQLSLGYKTFVGERGVKLSGGQRQRIAIARSLIKDAPILVLDEATSALDSESEKLIQDALWELMKDRTAILIAHRLSTIQKMDRIVVLDNGMIAEQGTHQQLLKSKVGIYANLWRHQSGGFMKD